MSSTNKTANLKLNNWIGTDVPKREDFNNDNEIVDTAITNHINDKMAHVTMDDRMEWSTYCMVQTYFGNGSGMQTIEFACDYMPTWGLVFASNTTPSLQNFTNKTNSNYFGIFTRSGCTYGLSLEGSKLKAYESATLYQGTQTRNFNEKGVTYVCVIFR